LKQAAAQSYPTAGCSHVDRLSQAKPMAVQRQYWTQTFSGL
jgi:hypothetical protein